MKKIMKQAGPALIQAAAAGGGGVASAYSNRLKSKLTFLDQAPAWAWPAIKIALATAVPFFIKNKKVKEIAQSAAQGACGVAAVELANATVTSEDPITIAGTIPTLGAAGYGNMDAEVGSAIPTLGNTSSTSPFPFE